MPDKKSVISVNVAPIVSDPNPIQLLAASQLMNCKSCGRIMYRGGQCDRCGAWCR